MSCYQIIAIRPGSRTKTINNRTADEVVRDIVAPFLKDGIVFAPWQGKPQAVQALEVRIYQTAQPYDKKARVTIEAFVKGCRNRYAEFEKRAKAITQRKRVFIVMPIQGSKSGTQDEKRVYREYDARFTAIEDLLQKKNCVAIRIDKEYKTGNLAENIRQEIQKSDFVIADLTDERCSCYYEAGYAEALKKEVLYIASKESVIRTSEKTKIHFDVHSRIGFFTDIPEMVDDLNRVIDKNRGTLLA